MGTRLSKAIGYGLDDCVGEGDPRFAVSPDTLFERLDSGARRRWSLNAFAAFATAKAEAVAAAGGRASPYRLVAHLAMRQIVANRQRSGLHWTPLDMVAYDSETMGGFFLLCGPGQQRHNDAIDWCVEAARTNGHPENLDPRAEAMPFGIHPFGGPMGGAWVDRASGRRIDQEIVQAALDPKEDDWRQALFDEAGYASTADFHARSRYQLPWDVEVFCEWTGLFRDPATVFSLKPMLVTWWS